MKQIIGLAGTFASGKDTGADYIESKYGYLHISTGDIVRAEATRRESTTHRDNLFDVANELRTTKGADVLVKEALVKYKDSERPGIVISGIRNPKEVATLKSAGGAFIFVDAPIGLRFERAKGRGRLEDNTTLEGFRAQEERELSNHDPAAQNISEVRTLADRVINNDDTLEELHNKIDEAIKG